MTGERDLSPEQVAHVAKLARLHITDEESALFAKQLGEILTYVDQLQKLPTDEVEATLGVQPRGNVFRDDEVTSSLTQEEVLSNAWSAENGGFRIPKILEESP